MIYSLFITNVYHVPLQIIEIESRTPDHQNSTAE